jgi:hypothetical protein
MLIVSNKKKKKLKKKKNPTTNVFDKITSDEDNIRGWYTVVVIIPLIQY